jgi:antitoxin YefM
MKSATITAFRQNMKKYLEQIQNDQDILILTGPKEKNYVVMTLEEFNSREETLHLFSTHANAKNLIDSMEEAEKAEQILKAQKKLALGRDRRKTSERSKGTLKSRRV